MKKIFIIAFVAVFNLSVTAQSYKASNQNKTTEQKLNDKYSTGMFKTADGQILDVASSTSAATYFNILEWLQGRVAGLQVYQSRTGLSIPVIRGTVAGVYVDEIPVSLSFLNSISSADIAMIKVIKSPFLGGFNGAGGAIAIYTFIGEEEEEEDNDSK